MQPENKQILITVKLNDNTKQAFSTLEKNAEKATDSLRGSLGGAITKLTSGFKSLVSGLGKVTLAIGVVAGAVTGAFVAFDKLAGRSGQIQQLQADFDKLTESIGETSEEMLSTLQVATKNTVSNFDLLTVGNKLMSMGLVTTQDEMDKVVTIATRLGKSTNTVTQNLDDFAALMANQSTPRLDNFGIASGEVLTRTEELQEEFKGMTRQTAWMTAMFEEADKSLAILGDTEETAGMGFAQFKATVQNLIDDTLVKLEPLFLVIAEEILPKVSSAIADFVDGFDSDTVVEKIENIRTAFNDFRTGWQEGSEMTKEETSAMSEFMVGQLNTLSIALGGTGVQAEHVAENIGIAWSVLKDVIKMAIQGIVGVIAWAINWWVSLFKMIKDSVESSMLLLTNLVGATKEFVSVAKGYWRDFKESIIGAIDRIKEKIQGLIDKAKEAASAAKSAVTPDFLEGNKQSGGTIGRAGFYDVGEAGKERVYLPQGSKVVPNDRITNNNNNSNVTINVNESIGDPSALASIVNFYLAR